MNDPLDQLAAQADAFEEKLLALKDRHRTPEFPWYPHHSLSGINLMAKFIAPERRDLLAILGKGPVLDLCTADGDLAFFLEGFGCAVHAIDWPITNMNFMRGIRLVHHVLNSRVEIHTCDLDARFAFPSQYYTAAFFLGGLYHLKNPYYVLEELAQHSYWCFLSTRIARFLPDRTPVRWAPVAYLAGADEIADDWTNYWIFSEGGLRRLVERAGWEITDFVSFGDTQGSEPVHPERDERAFCLLRSKLLAGPITVALLDGWHEIEEYVWRWTARRFSLRLSGIPGSSARFVLPFLLPASVLDRTGPLTLRVTANGQPLPPQTFERPGECLFVASLAGLAGSVDLVCETSAALPPDASDRRERALIIRPGELQKAVTSY